MVKVRYVNFHADEWFAGTHLLDNAERGLYITACALMYSHGGPIEVDHLKGACRDHGNAFNRQLNRLLDLGKLVLEGTQLTNKRVVNELEKADKRAINARQNGSKNNKNKGLRNPLGVTINQEPIESSLRSDSEASLRDASSRVRARDPGGVVLDLTKPVSRMSPVEKLYLGGYRAAQNVIRDLGLVADDQPPDVPLLDGRRPASDARGPG